ncbi:hypothetical protein LJB42_000794 [Komagataella kurtzmanii]|nr:hypothetical protein LJB42_000794 [Komagataella kurtzmanii]
MASDLINLQRDYLLKLIGSVETSNGLKCLVLDANSERLVNSLIDSNTLLRYVTTVERIDKKRQIRLSMEGVYLIGPTKFSVNCLLADFQINPTRYKKAHLLFLSPLARELTNLIMGNKQLEANTITRRTVDFTLLPLESHVFLSDAPDSLPTLYNENCLDLIRYQVSRAVQTLMNLCIITGEYPLVRYYSPQNPINKSSILPRMIAQEFQSTLDDYCRIKQDFPGDNPRPRSIFIITDRTMDLLAPLMHDFTYEAMCFDLLEFAENVDGDYPNTYRYSVENENGELLDREASLKPPIDDYWEELRNMHILDASNQLDVKLNKLITNNPMMVDRDKASGTRDFLFIVAHLHGFDEERRKIMLHKKLTEELLVINNERHLAECADFEQNCAAFGVSYDGEKIKDVASFLLSWISLDYFTTSDKIRLILIYAIYRGGLIRADVSKLVKFAGLASAEEHVMTLFENFSLLGFQLLKAHPKDKGFKKQFWHNIDSNAVLNTSRYKPAIQAIVELASKGILDEAAFPYIKDKPLEVSETNPDSATSLKNPRYRAAWSRKGSSYSPPKQRIVIYSAGGITYSEMKAGYDAGCLLNKDVFIGSDEVITPRMFVNNVIDLTSDRASLSLFYDRRRAAGESAPKVLFEQESHHRPSIGGPVDSSASLASTTSQSHEPPTNDKEKHRKRDKLKKFWK